MDIVNGICTMVRVTAAWYVEPRNSRGRGKEERYNKLNQRRELPRVMRSSKGCSEPLKAKTLYPIS